MGKGKKMCQGWEKRGGQKPVSGFRKLRSEGWTHNLGKALWLHVRYRLLRLPEAVEARKETVLGTMEKNSLGLGSWVELGSSLERDVGEWTELGD